MLLTQNETDKTATDATNRDRKGIILVCDDEYGPRQSLKMIFSEDYEVFLAETGPTAIEMAQNHPIDVAILDIKMAEMSGIQVLEQIKAIDPTTSVIMITGYEAVETAQQSIRLDASDYLNKPFEIRSIREAVTKGMEQRTAWMATRENMKALRQLQDEIQAQRLEGEIHRTRGEIYASVIHDINGPLTVISGIVQLLQRRFGTADRIEGTSLDNLRERLDQITRQVNKCIEISRRYLSFLRDRSAATSNVGVNQILTDLWELLKFYPSVNQNDLEIKPLQQEVFLEVNGTDLIQMLLNLVTNALQCSSQRHQVEVTAQFVEAIPNGHSSPEDGIYSINLQALAGTSQLLAISVRDDGPGIRSDLIPKIFESSFTTKDETTGTGLGLSIVHRLAVQNHCGVRLETAATQGTTFTLYMPVKSGS